MPIDKASDVFRLPRLGAIRHGYPKAVGYFIDTSSFHSTLGQEASG